MSAPTGPLSLADLESEVDKVLAAAGVFDIGSYGWLNENDADPEHIGHAMWQADQPNVDFSAVFGDAPVRRRPKELEKEVLTLGEDFCGLMKASRLSIGLTLLWERQATQTFLNESTFFRLHHMDAYLKLAMASDRLRDMLIVACTGSEAKNYRTTRQRREYVSSFNEATSLLALRRVDTSRLSESLAALPAQALSIYGFIDRRHKIVHEVATTMARSLRDTVAELQQKYDDQQTHGFTPRSIEFADLKHKAETLEEGYRRELANSVQELITWYKLLVDTSNHVFQVEYVSRAMSASNTS